MENEQQKETLKKVQSIEEMTTELISDYYKVKGALLSVKHQLIVKGGFDELVESIKEKLNEVQ
jgi:adenylate kinase family enzyme